MNHQYPNAPLTEVVCEFRFVPNDTWGRSVADDIYEVLRAKFPRRIEGDDRYSSEGYDVDATLQFWRHDHDGIVILSPDVLSVSHFRPYPGWERFREDVMAVVNAYVAVNNPQSFRRIGLRYINDIRLPATTEAINIYDYFRFGVIATIEGLPDEFTALSVKMDMRFHGTRDNLSISIICPTNEEMQHQHIELDLDYQLRQPRNVPIEEAEDWLNQAHNTINTVFEGVIRDKLRQQFNEEGC